MDSNTRTQKFKEALTDALGNSIRKPASAILGFKDENGTVRVQVPATVADEPRRYYFSQHGGQSFVGQAYLRQGSIDSWQLVYGTPIRVVKDVLNDQWEITGLDTRYSDQYFNGVVPDNLDLIELDQLKPGMLYNTVPKSMAAQVFAAPYTLGNTWKYIDNLQTIDFSLSGHMPPTNGLARLVLVQLDYDAEALTYKYGNTFPSFLTPIQAYRQHIANPSLGFIPDVDTGSFRCGFIKLIFGMTIIRRQDHIWTLQEYITNGGDVDVGSILSRIVCTDTDVVVVDGEVVWV